MKVVVLGGAGAMGTHATPALAASGVFEQVVLADIDVAKARAQAAAWGLPPDAAAALDAADESALAGLMAGAAVVVNALPKNFVLPVARTAIAARVNIRVCLVVDPDVNIYDPADVLWALTSRVDWGRDVFMVPGAQGHEMDPANDARGIGTKLGIDATFDKGRREYGERVRYHPVDLSQYLGN